ncbi:unnamed protein product [Ixodes persulcatus]
MLCTSDWEDAVVVARIKGLRFPVGYLKVEAYHVAPSEDKWRRVIHGVRTECTNEKKTAEDGSPWVAGQVAVTRHHLYRKESFIHARVQRNPERGAGRTRHAGRTRMQPGEHEEIRSPGAGGYHDQVPIEYRGGDSR